MREAAPFSVLMSTYHAVPADWLAQALESLMRQTVLPSQIVLVIDGEIPADQQEVVCHYHDNAAGVQFLVVKQLPQKGLASAMNLGLRYTTQPWIARMDSDDIARSDRFEVQWKTLREDCSIDVVFSWHQEFEEQAVTGLKVCPSSHLDIKRLLNYRNVVSHPTIVAKKKLFVQNGGYSEVVGLLEDYDLHLRFISAGAKYYCVPLPLMQVRTSEQQRRRRGGWIYMRTELAFRTRALREGHISFAGWIVGAVAMPVFRLVPHWIRAWMYSFVRIRK